MALTIKYFDKASISEKVLSIILLQVSPGNESKISEQIKTWQKENLKHPVLIYKGLGRYDLVVIQESDNFELVSNFNTFQNEAIVDVNYFTCFKWTKKASEAMAFKFDAPLVGICFIKLKNRRKSMPILNEQKVVQSIYNAAEKGEFNISVYGGFGWNELIAIIPSTSVNELSKDLDLVKEAVLTEDVNCLLDTSTIPGINFDLIANEQFEKLNEAIDATVLIGSSQPYANLKEFCNSEFGKTSTAFGFHDFVIECKNVLLGDFVEKILSLRKQEGLLYSYSILKHAETMNFSSPTNLSSPIPCKNVSEPILSVDDREVNLVRYYEHLFSVLQNDPLTKDFFPKEIVVWNRLVELINKFKEFKNTKPDEYRQGLLVFYTSIDCLRTLFIERYTDVPIANLLGGKTPFSEFYGGSSRLMKAVESIPTCLIQIIGQEWKGVCIHGYYDRYRTLFAGIINVPGKDVMEPENFWGLFHETGHEIYNALDTYAPEWKSVINKTIDEQLAEAKSDIQLNIEQQNIRYGWHLTEEQKINSALRDYAQQVNWTQHYASELFAELFSFKYGFCGDWSRWKQHVWSWFTSEYGPRLDFLTRSIIIALIYGPYSDRWPAELKQTVDEIITELETTTPISIESKVVIDDQLKEMARLDIARNFELALTIKKLLDCSLISTVISDGELEKVYSDLDAGIPFSVTISQNKRDVTPIVLVNALMFQSKKRRISLRSKLTAIMSLYNYYSTFK